MAALRGPLVAEEWAGLFIDKHRLVNASSRGSASLVMMSVIVSVNVMSVAMLAVVMLSVNNMLSVAASIMSCHHVNQAYPIWFVLQSF